MSFISKFFGNDGEEFSEVRVDREVLESVIYYAKKAYPNEFLAFFDGEIRDEILYITSLIFLPGETCETGAVIHTEMIPMNTKYMGSVHSHPGPSAQPSDADLMTFSRHGYFHMIVCLPYSLATFKSYNRYGEPVDYTLGDFSHIIDDNSDEFFKTLDEERKNIYEEKFEKQPHIQVVSNTQMPQNVIKIELNPDGSVKKVTKNKKIE